MPPKQELLLLQILICGHVSVKKSDWILIQTYKIDPWNTVILIVFHYRMS